MGTLNRRSGNKTNVVRARGGENLTKYDPIKDHVGQHDTNVHNAAGGPKAQSVKQGSVVRARDARKPRKEGEQGVALPRRDYERS